MRSFRFNPKTRAPIITALITGPKASRKLRLIFDTGAEMTQLHAGKMFEIGYSTADAIAKARVVGVGGVEGEGYMIKLQKLFVLGCKAETLDVGVFEMPHLNSCKIDGLLGWDVIRAFHLEMHGPGGWLKIFDQ